MTGLSSFRSHQLLTIVVPAIIAFLSVYWFRKKRKLKCMTNGDVHAPVDVTEQCAESCDGVETTHKVTDSKCNILNGILDHSVTTMQSHLFSHKDEPVVVENGVTVGSLQMVLPSIKNSNETCCSPDEVCTETLSTIESSNVFEFSNMQTPDISSIILDSESSPKDVLSEPDKLVEDTDTNNESAEAKADDPACEVDTVVDSIELNHHSEADVCNTAQKSSPTSTGSPVSHTLDFDSEALSSVGTSSVSLNELFSTSPVDSVKEPNHFSSDSIVDELSAGDSGKGSTPNLDPSSSSLSSELGDSPKEETKKDIFRYTRRSNADVLCKQETDCMNEVNHQLSLYDDSSYSSSGTKKSSDTMSEVTSLNNCSSSGMSYVPFMAPSMVEPNSNNLVYEFELPQELCGRLIGRLGNHVKFIKERTNATVYVKRHPYNLQLKLAVIEGSRCDVYDALELIRKKFPTSQFPNVSLSQTNAARRSLYFYYLLPTPSYIFNSWLQNFTDLLSANSFPQLNLPENLSVDVILSSMVSAGHFFLQQPTHHTYPSLSNLDHCMLACYSQLEAPQLPEPIEAGVICAAPTTGGWYRAQVVFVYEDGENCDIRFVDYGGYSKVPTSSLRQIRNDFMVLPFQAAECYLANVQPLDVDAGWSNEASAAFEELAQGQILQAFVVDYHEDRKPYVCLYRVQGINNTFINQELVNRGLAKWIDHQ